MAGNKWYGLDKTTVDELKAKWKTRIRDNCTWKRFEDFLYWAAQNEYRCGMILKRHNSSISWGADNIYIANKKEMQMQEPTDCVSSFCVGCKRECPAGNGCKDWQNWFVQNWNQNIHREKPTPKKELFRYEAPDLIREGIANG